MLFCNKAMMPRGFFVIRNSFGFILKLFKGVG